MAGAWASPLLRTTPGSAETPSLGGEHPEPGSGGREEQPHTPLSEGPGPRRQQFLVPQQKEVPPLPALARHGLGGHRQYPGSLRPGT